MVIPPNARRSLSSFPRRARMNRVGENGSGPEARRDPAAQAGPSRWNLVAIRRWRNPFLIFALRKSTKLNKKAPSADGAILRVLSTLMKTVPFGTVFFFCIFRLIPVNRPESKGEFRPLRSPTQGNGARVLGPWPSKSATALRENAPQGPFLAPQGSRKAGESFSDWCGAVPYSGAAEIF